MPSSLSPAVLPDDLAEVARKLAVIMAGLAGVVAARFLRMPALAGLIVPLRWRLQRVSGRFSKKMVRRVTAAKPRRAAAPRAAARPRKPGVRLPGGKGWLVRVLGYEAAGYGSQLAHLLTDPAMQAAIAEVPGVGRVLRPICRMLAVDWPAVAVAPVVVEPGVAEPELARAEVPMAALRVTDTPAAPELRVKIS